jgi:hypothetical protein
MSHTTRRRWTPSTRTTSSTPPPIATLYTRAFRRWRTNRLHLFPLPADSRSLDKISRLTNCSAACYPDVYIRSSPGKNDINCGTISTKRMPSSAKSDARTSPAAFRRKSPSPLRLKLCFLFSQLQLEIIVLTHFHQIKRDFTSNQTNQKRTGRTARPPGSSISTQQLATAKLTSARPTRPALRVPS